MTKIHNMMTRIVAIGTVEKIEYNDKVGSGLVKGTLKCDGNNKANFTMFNPKEGVPKASNMYENVKVGDKIYITGQDNRTYSETKDTYYEDIMLWDWRLAEEEEKPRWVFVYIGNIQSLEDDNLELLFINYKDEEMIYPINMKNTELKGELEVGCRVKIKGEIFVGREEDFYGDGQFVTKRNAAVIEVLNTAEEIEADKADDSSDEKNLWSN